jgi:hypothetical protein
MGQLDSTCVPGTLWANSQNCSPCLTDGGVGAAAGLHGADAARVQRLVPHQELAVLAREDVVGDRRGVERHTS